MSEIAIRDDRDDLVPADAPSSALILWAHEARQAAQIATSLARTSFVPTSLRGKPEDITAAILAGQELGLRPMAALRSMDIIQGTPALRAHAMRGLLQSHGHSIQLVESTESVCRMRGRRAGEQEWQQVEWTIERATRMGLMSKDQWKKQPTAMLIARATGELCRLIASDVLHAMPYATEEFDGLPAQGGDVEPPVAGQVTAAEIVQRARPVEAPPAPPAVATQRFPEPTVASLPAANVPPADDNPAAAMVSTAQHRAMHALWRELGYDGDANREQRLDITRRILNLDEPLETSSELTAAEADRVIEALRAKKRALDAAGAQ